MVLIYSCSSVGLAMSVITLQWTIPLKKTNSPSILQQPSTARISAAKDRNCDSLCGAHSTNTLCSNVDKFDLLWILFGQQQLLSLHDCDTSVMTDRHYFIPVLAKLSLLQPFPLLPWWTQGLRMKSRKCDVTIYGWALLRCLFSAHWPAVSFCIWLTFST